VRLGKSIFIFEKTILKERHLNQFSHFIYYMKGLMNIGNTCYLNSAIQMILNMKIYVFIYMLTCLIN